MDRALIQKGVVRTEKVSGFFYVALLVSAIGAFVFGFSLGFTSPTFLAQYQGTAKDAETECILVEAKCEHQPCYYTDSAACVSAGGDWVNGTCAGPQAKGKMNCELKMSDEMSSWFGSLINIGCLVGALVGGSVADAIGKKNGMLLSYVFYLVGWLCICLAPKDPSTVDDSTVVKMLVASRLLIGFAIGFTCCTVSNYQTETCPTPMRGMIGTVFQVFIVLGLAAAYLVGTVLNNWRHLAWIMAASSTTGLALTPFLCETPVYLLLKGKKTEAAQALRRLRTADTDITYCMDELSSDDGDIPSGGCGVLFGGGAPTKALMIGIGLMFVQQLSGINAVMFYCGTILQSVFNPDLANKVAVGIQVMQLGITIVSAPLMDKAGRVPILLFAASGQCIAAGVRRMRPTFFSTINSTVSTYIEASN